MKQWLLEIRNNSGEIGRLALKDMETRARKWRTRREKDPLLRMSRVGSAVELVTTERIECKHIPITCIATLTTIYSQSP
jgi:exocyst complex component 6